MISLSDQDPTSDIIIFSEQRTAALLDFHCLVDEIAQATLDYEAGLIASPERMVVPLGESGVMLSMPATAPDVGIHKLVNVQPSNASRSLPTIHGAVTVCDAATGRIQFVLDGPVVTGRRTAAVSLLAIRTLLGREPEEILLIGTGAQSSYHLQALKAVHPQSRVWVRGRSSSASEAFCEKADTPGVRPCPEEIPANIDVVITLTTSTSPVYSKQALPNRLVIGVGAFKPDMAEIGKATLDASVIYADDPVGARHEAGDLLRAEVDWNRVRSLATALREPRDTSRPIVFKSVGTAAWDLAAARVALKALKI